jgi:hypothetical protein
MKTYAKMTLKQLAAEYNHLAETLHKEGVFTDFKPIKKFSDRESAIRRTTELFKLAPGDSDNNGRGRPSSNAGKKIFPIVDGNPRLAGSHGYHAFKIVQDKPGILYEDYIAAGGESHHLRWDVQRKFLEVR